MNTNGGIKQFNKYLYILIFIIIIFIILFLLFFNKKSSFTLIDGDITLKFNEAYNEPGYKYIDKNGKDLTEEVIVNNNIDVLTPGTYEITYKYNDEILKRKVVVLEPSSYKLSIILNQNITNLTNEDVIVDYKVNGETFKKIDLIDNKNVKESEGSFKITENGIYTVVAYNIKDEKFEQKIEINNIDKEKPSATCVATINLKSGDIKVDAKDNNKVGKYEYFDNDKKIFSSLLNSYEANQVLSDNILVKVYDEAGNYSDIKCEIIDKRYYDPILPLANEEMVFKGETDTFKAYITKNSGYYLTRIWVKDAYNQLNKAVSPDYGIGLYKPIDLLKQELNKKNLTDKLIVGFNASGFYLKDTFDAASVNRYPAYDRTSVGTIVINNGVVVRNAYNYAVKQWYLTGITKDNKMVVFEDNIASTTIEKEQKQKWSEEVINSGIRNTLSFAGPVILNGQQLTKFSRSMPDPENNTVESLQMICQINENNFVLFTSTSANRKTAINIFMKLGCITAVNLDGGGSRALLYKEKNSTEFKTITGGSRTLPEAGYFTE